MIRPLLLVLCAGSLFSAAIPDQLDLRANRQPLSEVLESIADQCGAGLVVPQVIQDRLKGVVTLTARKASWADASRWLADEFRMTMQLVGERLEIGDSDRAFRDRLVSVTYDIEALTKAQAPSSFPGPNLEIPEPGGHGSQLMPAIEPGAQDTRLEFAELVEQIEPNSWKAEGVGVHDFSVPLVITHVPEIHQRIAELVATLERAAARQVMVRCYRLPAGTPQTAVLDAGTWATMAKGLAAPIGVVQLLDEQRNSHFSGIQRGMIADADINQDAFQPVLSVISDGLMFDLDVHVTNGGVVTTTSFATTSKQHLSPAPLTSTNGKVITPIELIARNHGATRDTRVIPDGGAAVYRVGDQIYALSVEVLDLSKQP